MGSEMTSDACKSVFNELIIPHGDHVISDPHSDGGFYTRPVDTLVLPDDEYLNNVGKALYLFAWIESRVAQGVTRVYEVKLLSDRSSDDPEIIKLRNAAYGKMSSGKSLHKALREVLAGFLDKSSDLSDRIICESYMQQSIDLWWASVDSRNLLAHAGAAPHMYEGMRLRRQYLKKELVRSINDGATRSEWRGPGRDGGALFINDEWLDGFVSKLSMDVQRLADMEKSVDLYQTHPAFQPITLHADLNVPHMLDVDGDDVSYKKTD